MKNKEIAKACEKISKAIIYLTAFLVPIFSLSKTTTGIDFPKQILLIFLVFIALFFWALKILTSRRVELNLHRFNVVVIIFLFIIGLSTIFSFYRYGSFWGLPLDIASSFLTVLSLVLFYFLIINLLRRKEEILWLLFTLVFSTFLAALIGNFQIIGLWPSFNTMGSVVSLGIFSASILALISSLVFGIIHKSIKYMLLGTELIIFVLLILINSWIAWLVLSIGLIVVLLIGTARFEFTRNPLWLLLSFVLVIALFFGIFRVSLFTLQDIPSKTLLPLKSSVEVVGKSLANYPVLGSGPGTFSYSYYQFEPEYTNNTDFWATHFDSTISSALDRLITTGILGLLAWLGFLGAFIWLAFRRLLRSFNPIDTVLNLGILAGWAGIALGLFLYPSNLSLEFLFWTLTASFIALDVSQINKWKFKSSTFFRIFLIFLLVSLLGIKFLFTLGEQCVAEANYSKGLRAVQDNNNQAGAGIEYIAKAIKLTKANQDNYLRDLAQLYLVEALSELKRQNALTEEEKNFDYAVQLISFSINSAKSATEASPKNSANWVISGLVYKEASNLDSAAIDWAIKSYKEAIYLEPVNPLLYTELGQAYLVKADIHKANDSSQSAAALSDAQKHFQKAIELKPDYIPAYLQISQLYIRQEQIEKAITELESAQKIVPFSIDVGFQLSLVYYSDNQFDKAKPELERVILLNPNYSNAYYVLGLIYDSEGNKDKAIENFIKVAKLNPDNENVLQILENLRAGKPAIGKEQTTDATVEPDLGKQKTRLPISE